MQLSDKVKVKDWIKKRWPKDQGLADGEISVNTALVSGYAFSRAAAESAERIEAAVAKLAQNSGVEVDVDEDAIVAGVLAGLTPERIAAAIPAELAEQVVSALGARLAPEEGP